MTKIPEHAPDASDDGSLVKLLAASVEIQELKNERDELNSLNEAQGNTILAVVRLSNVRARRIELLERRLAYALEHYKSATGAELEMGLVV